MRSLQYKRENTHMKQLSPTVELALISNLNDFFSVTKVHTRHLHTRRCLVSSKRIEVEFSDALGVMCDLQAEGALHDEVPLNTMMNMILDRMRIQEEAN